MPAMEVRGYDTGAVKAAMGELEGRTYQGLGIVLLRIRLRLQKS